MSFKLEGEKCPICHAYFFEEDDIVYCPECGAPHHRDCYNSIGHCGLEELHGTDSQYDRVKAQQKEKEEKEKKEAPQFTQNEPKLTTKCGMCGEDYDFNARVCPKCGAPNMQHMNGFVQFDFLGGVPADLDIGDGVTAGEAKRFVMSNTPRYIPKFAAMKLGKRTSWNWLAFLFPCGWFLSRKMYLNGVIVGIISVAITLMQFPFLMAFSNLGLADIANQFELSRAIIENISSIGAPAIILLVISGLAGLALRLISAIFGDYWYRSYTISSIKRIRAESEDMDADYRKLGGVNLFAMLIGLMVIQYVPTIIFSLL